MGHRSCRARRSSTPAAPGTCSPWGIERLSKRGQTPFLLEALKRPRHVHTLLTKKQVRARDRSYSQPFVIVVTAPNECRALHLAPESFVWREHHEEMYQPGAALEPCCQPRPCVMCSGTSERTPILDSLNTTVSARAGTCRAARNISRVSSAKSCRNGHPSR